MVTFGIRRLVQAVIVLILVTIIVFVAMRLLPGDPVRMLITASQQRAYSEEQITLLRHKFGLDRPIVIQYFDWLLKAVQGDLGISIRENTPVAEQIVHRFPITVHLGLVAFFIGIIVGIPIGVVSAVRRATWIDTLVTTLANIGITLPVFWLGIILIYFFSLYLKWLPVMGYTSPFTDFWLSTKQLIMPVACLAVFPIASTARQTRSSLLEVMRQDYIRTAWSKGLSERSVIIGHALKNGLIPVITLSGMLLTVIIGGEVLIETVFNIPGMGRLLVTSVINQDYPYVQGIVLIMAVIVLLVNLAVDIIYSYVDPKIQLE
jgi:peptide/nickel transport system permease protein